MHTTILRERGEFLMMFGRVAVEARQVVPERKLSIPKRITP